jgi:two-component system chemotaxis response regulator CheB
MPIKINNPFDPTTKLEIQPGEFYISESPMLLTTILGSCVAVCIFDREKRIGGMNHFLLPTPQTSSDKNENLNKYASYCIPALLKAFKKAGSNPSDLDVKILGGANIFDGASTSFSSAVGRDNITAAREILKQFGLTISGENVGGERGRRIELNTHTGEIRFQKLNAMETEKRKNVIKVLIVDDAKPMRMILRKIIDNTPGFKVIAEAESANEAILARKKEKPDVITLDINMPGMDGVTYLKQYMPIDPTPTVIVTSYSAADSPHVLEALKHGAFDHLGKPTMNNLESYEQNLIETLRAAYANKGKVKLKNIVSKGLHIFAPQDFLEKTLIVIGSSTGGTEALRVVLKSFPSNTPPILIVQHIPPVFSRTFAESLNESCSMKAKEAESGDMIENGKIYVAQGGRHMKIIGTGSTMRIELTDDPEVNKFRPSVDYMFRSVRSIMGKRKDLHVIGVLLTGMGADGAEGLLELRRAGAETIAQDEETSVVFGMPKEAINRGAAKHVAAITDVAGKVVEIINRAGKTRTTSKT